MRQERWQTLSLLVSNTPSSRVRCTTRNIRPTWGGGTVRLETGAYVCRCMCWLLIPIPLHHAPSETSPYLPPPSWICNHFRTNRAIWHKVGASLGSASFFYPFSNGILPLRSVQLIRNCEVWWQKHLSQVWSAPDLTYLIHRSGFFTNLYMACRDRGKIHGTSSATNEAIYQHDWWCKDIKLMSLINIHTTVWSLWSQSVWESFAWGLLVNEERPPPPRRRGVGWGRGVVLIAVLLLPCRRRWAPWTRAVSTTCLPIRRSLVAWHPTPSLPAANHWAAGALSGC